MTVEHAVAGLTVVPGDPDAVADALPEALAPVRLPTGHAIVLLLAVDYVDNPLGDYDEVVVGMVARPRGPGGTVHGLLHSVLRGHHGVWIEHMAVSQPFTREAGEAIWGYPKTLDELGFDHRGRRARCTWARDGRSILTLEQPTRTRLPAAPPLRMTTYTQVDGTVMTTRLTARARRIGIAPGSGEIHLGDHPVADQLRGLGLQRAPLATVWLARTRMRFSTARPLPRGSR
jgi:hypothetical protein